MSQEIPGQGEGRHDQQVWREQSAGLGKAAENEFANEARAAELRAKVDRVAEEIATRQASIEQLVVQMQEGEKRAAGNEKLTKINESLQAEAQAQKVQLLGEVEALKKEQAAAEDELLDL